MTASVAAHRHRVVERFQALVAGLHLLAHVGDVEVGDDADLGEQRGGRVGVVGVDVDLEGGLVAHDEHGVSELLQFGDVAALAPGRRR